MWNKGSEYFDDLERVRNNAIKEVKKNSPSYLYYITVLNWRAKHFKDKNGLRTMGYIRGNTVFLNEEYIDSPKMIDVILHELAHKIDSERNGLKTNAHDDSFFDIYEKLSGKPQRQKYLNGVKVK
jgi:hypothetical protein